MRRDCAWERSFAPPSFGLDVILIQVIRRDAGIKDQHASYGGRRIQIFEALQIGNVSVSFFLRVFRRKKHAYAFRPVLARHEHPRQPEGCCLFEMRFHAAFQSSFPRRVERQVFAC